MDVDLTGLQKPSLFEKFKLQVIKDYEMAGAASFSPIIQSNNLDYLKDAFHQSILKLELGNSLKNLLYRIDITELQIKTAASKNPEMPLQMLLSELIIKRILQKVVLKELYSKQ